MYLFVTLKLYSCWERHNIDVKMIVNSVIYSLFNIYQFNCIFVSAFVENVNSYIELIYLLYVMLLGWWWPKLEADPPENCHLNVKKLPKIVISSKICRWQFKKRQFLATFWHSIGSFPEGQLLTLVIISPIT